MFIVVLCVSDRCYAYVACVDVDVCLCYVVVLCMCMGICIMSGYLVCGLWVPSVTSA